MIIVNVDQAIKDLKAAFSNLSKQEIEKAQAVAINRTLIFGRSEIKKFIKNSYNVKSADMKDLFINKAKPGRLTGSIGASNKNISLSHFNPRFDFTAAGKASTIRISRTKNGLVKSTKFKRGSAGKGVSVEIKKGSRVSLPYAFMVRNESTMPVFARGRYQSGGSNDFIHGKNRLPITKLLSTSLGAIAIKEPIQARMQTNLTPYFKNRMIHEINYRLKKMR
jgi:hypothetical protein